MLGANAIVGGGPPIAVGAAIATQHAGQGPRDRVLQRRWFRQPGHRVRGHEPGRGAASCRRIFVYENNGYSEHTGADYAVGSKDLASRAAAFGMPAEKVDGTDFFAVFEAAGRAVERARAGRRAQRHRVRHHPLSSATLRATRKNTGPGTRSPSTARPLDCLANFRDRVTAEGWLTEPSWMRSTTRCWPYRRGRAARPKPRPCPTPASSTPMSTRPTEGRSA